MAKYQTLVGGYKIPSIGLGTYQERFKEQIVEGLNAALEAGYRLIDTAYLYENEAYIGKGLKEWFNSGKLKREDIFLTSKLPPQGVQSDRVELFLNKSLKALQLDYVDLYLIHIPICVEYVEGAPLRDELEGLPTDLVAVWKKLEEQVDAGKAKAIGLSNCNIEQIQRIWDSARIKPALLQIEISPYFQQKELVEFCKKIGLPVEGFATLGTADTAKIFKERGLMDPNAASILDDSVLKKIADKHKKSTAQVILRFFIQKNIIMIPKSYIPSELRENLDVFGFSLTQADITAIEGLDRGEKARLIDYGMIHPKLKDHPEFPFNK